MTLATGGKLRQFVVEFIRGEGIKTNGIVDASQGTIGPFVWRIPSDVSLLYNLIMVPGGAGGAGGGLSATSVISVGGGGGASSGYTVYATKPASVVPNTDLKITVGRAGIGSAPGVNSFQSGTSNQPTASQIEPNSASDFGILGAFHQGTSGLAVSAPYNNTYAGSASTTTFAGGGLAGGTSDSGGTGAGGSTAGANGSGGGSTEYELLGGGTRLRHISNSGTGGGAGGGTAGATGGNGGNGGFGNVNSRRVAPSTAGLGTSTGVLSMGGGGNGAGTFLGRGGTGGNGGNPGSIGLGYGAGGGGGGGNAAGGNGTPGYVRFTYWSAK